MLYCAKSLQSCLTVCNPVDCSLPGSSVHGISQANILEWIAIPFSRRASDPGIEPTSLMSPVSACGFFPTCMSILRINSVYMSVPILLPTPFPLGIHTFVLYVCVFISPLQIRLFIHFFLDSTYSELYLMLRGDLNGEEVQKGEDICIYTDDSFCCPLETNAAL